MEVSHGGQRGRLIGSTVHLLGGLVGPEGEATASTFDNDSWAQSTQDAGLVVLGGVQLG